MGSPQIDSAWNQLVALTQYTIFSLCMLVVGYRLLLHPLSAYPGPLVAKLTEGYGAWFAARKRLYLVTYENFQKYGPVVRQAPNRLIFNTAQALHDIYLNPRVIKGQAYQGQRIRSKNGSTINTIPKAEHRRKRKALSKVFSDRSLRAFEPVMESQVDVFLQILLQASQNGSALDMSERCQRLTVDVINHLGFGYPLKTQTEETYRFVPALLNFTSFRINTYMQLPMITFLDKFLALFGVKIIVKFGEFIQTMIKTRLAAPKDAHNDLYYYIADEIGDGPQAVNAGELWPEAVMFITAGGTTTSTAMSALFFYLSQNPSSYATLAAEIRSTFSSAREVRPGAQLNGCKYLRACIDEALRMSPPTLAPLWRQQDDLDESGEPLIVDGHVIPRGTQVAISPYAIMHNEQYFPDSFTYKPERWLDDGHSNEAETAEQRDSLPAMRRAFAPFTLGDRGCPGKSLAYLEMNLMLARVLWYFDFENAPGVAEMPCVGGSGRKGEFQVGDAFIALHSGPNLTFRKRGDFWKELNHDKVE